MLYFFPNYIAICSARQ